MATWEATWVAYPRQPIRDLVAARRQAQGVATVVSGRRGDAGDARPLPAGLGDDHHSRQGQARSVRHLAGDGKTIRPRLSHRESASQQDEEHCRPSPIPFAHEVPPMHRHTSICWRSAPGRAGRSSGRLWPERTSSGAGRGGSARRKQPRRVARHDSRDCGDGSVDGGAGAGQVERLALEHRGGEMKDRGPTVLRVGAALALAWNVRSRRGVGLFARCGVRGCEVSEMWTQPRGEARLRVDMRVRGRVGMRLRVRVGETVGQLEGTVGVVGAVADVVEEGLNVQAKAPQERRYQGSRSTCGPDDSRFASPRLEPRGRAGLDPNRGYVTRAARGWAFFPLQAGQRGIGLGGDRAHLRVLWVSARPSARRRRGQEWPR